MNKIISSLPGKDEATNIIIGCGKLGASIAMMMSAQGKVVITMDSNAAAFKSLGSGYCGINIECDGTDIDALKDAGIKTASHVIVVTDNDNVNLMISQIAKRIFAVPSVVVRLNDPDKEAIVREYGIKVIYPNRLTTSALEEILVQNL